MGSSLSQQSAVDIINEWRSKPAHVLVFDSSRPEVYLQAVDRLQQSPNMKRYSELLSVAMARLQREFRDVLSRQAEYQAAAGPNSTVEWSTVTDSTAYTLRYEDYAAYEPPSREVIIYLKNIIERMNLNGNLGECIKLYKSVRKIFLQSHLKRLRFDELRIGDNNSRRYLWEDYWKLKIELWIQASKICVKILFEREKQFCGQIFETVGGDSVKDECFVGTVDEFAVSLFAFAETISMGNHPYDKMGTVFGLYDAFWSVLPDVEALFASESGGVIRSDCVNTLSKIEKDVERMLYEFENTMSNAISDFSDDRGEVNRTTVFVMDQIEVIVRYKILLTNLIKSDPSLTFNGLDNPQEEVGDLSDRSFLEVHVILIIVLLLRKLLSNAKICGDLALENLFMMNNVHYIVQKIEGSEKLQEMIGDSYLTKLKDDVLSARTSYQELTCGKFLPCFRDEGRYIMWCFKFHLSKSALRKRLKAFNAVFEEIQQRHSSWIVMDSQLAGQIRVAMKEELVPAYRNFLGKFKNDPEMEPLEKKIFKYSAKDLEDLVLERLFSGSRH